MKKLTTILILIMLACFTASPLEADSNTKSNAVGFIFRPDICMSNCSVTIVTFGVETVHKMFAFAFRYGYKDNAHYFYPDLRFFWDIPIIPRLFVTPLGEFTPMFGYFNTSFYDASYSSFFIHPQLRTGVRVRYDILPNFAVFLEPMLLEFTPYRGAVAWGTGMDSEWSDSWKFVVNYAFSTGVQFRY
jgi:hypothetical protein